MVFGHACAISGKEEFVFRLFSEARPKAAQMRFFGVPHTDAAIHAFHQLSPDRIRAKLSCGLGSLQLAEAGIVNFLPGL